MPLGLGSLHFNLYISVGLNALSGLLSNMALLFVIGRMRRKVFMGGLCLLSGICNLAGVFVGLKGWKIGMELLSFFWACMAFNVLLVYVMEMFPTCVRNSAVSVVREAILLGGFLGPVVVEVGRATAKGNGFIPYGVFGVTILVCGLFVLWLPETKGRVLFDTMEEEENYRGGGVGVDGA
ncbi:Organic cation/carnitine transporter 3 [Striga hermonthica]|uniref:Organic cation/carnitine transporter 3 n=1 Tax=Striga hermonthica TaxID=68872 RepID=A0A9N7R7E0_STRHE|nr:Organic cation/carnitine transporter 3 [Striga hermonthica]